METLFFLDSDDLDTREKPLFDEFPDLKLKFFIHEPVVTNGERYNFLVTKASGDILMYSADDVVFEKKNWDIELQEIFDALPDKLALVFSPDIIHGTAIPTHGFVSKKSVDLLGYLIYPHFVTAYGDVWLADLYRSLGRYIHYDLGIVHQHYSQGFGDRDETYIKQEAKVAQADQIWQEHRITVLPKHVEVLREHLCQKN